MTRTIARSARLADNHAMAIRALFPTLVYRELLGGPDIRRFNQDMADECRSLAVSDAAGRHWSAQHYLGGYTSYGSLDRLHLVSSLFAKLRRRIDPHIKAFAQALHYDLGGRSLAMTDCWANVMPAGVVHSLHLHPTSFVSGTYYVEVPKGAGRPEVRGSSARPAHGDAAAPGRCAPKLSRLREPAGQGGRSAAVRELVAP